MHHHVWSLDVAVHDPGFAQHADRLDRGLCDFVGRRHLGVIRLQVLQVDLAEHRRVDAEIVPGKSILAAFLGLGERGGADPQRHIAHADVVGDDEIHIGILLGQLTGQHSDRRFDRSDVCLVEHFGGGVARFVLVNAPVRARASQSIE